MKLIADHQIFQCDFCGKCFFTMRGAKRHEGNHIKRAKKTADPEKCLGIPLFGEEATK
jgi:hypothetical protein